MRCRDSAAFPCGFFRCEDDPHGFERFFAVNAGYPALENAVHKGIDDAGISCARRKSDSYWMSYGPVDAFFRGMAYLRNFTAAADTDF